MSFAALLDRTVSISRQQPAPDGAGGTTRTWKTMATAIPASIQSGGVRDQIRVMHGTRELVSTHKVFTVTNLDAILSGGVRIGDRVSDGTYTYLVCGWSTVGNTIISSQAVTTLQVELIRE